LTIEKNVYDFWIKFEKINAIPNKKLELLKKSKIILNGDEFFSL
jgi:hypothetical protein